MPSCRSGMILLGALALAGALPAVARADSITYIANGQIWVANADGSGARQFTDQANGWSSPSLADDGTLVAAGGRSRINADGSDSDGSSELYRFKGDGTPLGSPIPTYGSRSTPACPPYPPSSVRVSPDASKIAYGILACGDGGHQVALWTPANATGLSFPNQTQGQVDFWDPVWIDSSHFTISHAGPPTGAHWGEHATGDRDNVGAGWHESAMDDLFSGTVRSAEAVISRSGKLAAVFFNDAHSWTDRKPRHVDLWIYSNPAMPASFSGSYDPRCKIALDAGQIPDVYSISPSLSPDGGKLLWGDARGVELTTLGNVAGGCAALSTRLLVPGGREPFYGAGALQAAGARKPVARFKVKTAHARAGKKVVFDARSSRRATSYAWKFGDGRKAKGRKVSHRFKRRGRYTVRLTVRGADGSRATVKHKVKVVR
jgi:hypothetical protein